MAKPRVFISSTFYDLRQVRADIDTFIDQLGYESVRNEEGNIPYGKEEGWTTFLSSCPLRLNKVNNTIPFTVFV